jgi:hypothetical protein
MSLLVDQLRWLEDLPVATAIAESDFLFPTIETVHVLALALFVGTIAYVDLRLIGLLPTRRGLIDSALEILPVTWASFAVAVPSGALLFMSNAVRYVDITAFRVKFVLLLLAGLNMAIFHAFAWRLMKQRNAVAKTPAMARLAGLISLVLWIGVVASGRWIGFATH